MSSDNPERVGVMTWLALLLSAAVVGGSLYLSLGMGLIACPLCFYQRTFAIAVLCVLAVGILGGVRPAWRLSLLALAPAFGGLGMAGWHYSLVASGEMICPDGAFGLGSAPLQSLVAFGVLTLILCCDIAAGCRSTSGACGHTTLGGFTAGVLGLGLAFASVKATHIVPPPKDFADIDKICRKAPPKDV
jgi:disulfide bond formation protein DsbB